ncbi:MAG: MalY/PatB family protein [Bacillota bacterium]|nr:MalY/PatB family protein [Bacillota bacterium]
MTYNFDTIVNRKNTSSLKYDFGLERKGRDDLLPLWVADMDFSLPEEILQTIKERVDHGIFGYTDPKEDYKNSVIHWYEKKHNWKIEPEWITVTPGVVYAISTAIRAFTNPKDTILIQQPVYYPFSECVLDNDRILVNSQLKYENGKYSIDYDDFEKKIIENDVKLFILCSPHNPVGRVWTKEELERIGNICLKHNVLVFSDEIHCDITYKSVKHIPFASISESFKNNVIVGTSASKTFNIAGLQVSNIIIPNDKLRKVFKQENAAAGYSQANVLGLVGTKAVYDLGEAWYTQLLAYLEENLKFVRDYLEKEIPQIKLIEPEGTYLIWLDCSALGLSSEELEDVILNKAKLWLDRGAIFGKETSLFERINIACPRSILKEALERLKNAL